LNLPVLNPRIIHSEISVNSDSDKVKPLKQGIEAFPDDRAAAPLCRPLHPATPRFPAALPAGLLIPGFYLPTY